MRPSAGPRRGVLPLLAALALLLSTGCQARLSLEVAVDRDGAGELALLVGADAELLDQAAQAGADPLGDLAATGGDLAEEGWSVSDVTDDEGARTVRLARPFSSPEQLAVLADELSAALAAPELVPFEDLRVVVEDDVVRVSGVAGLVPTAEVTAFGVQPEQAVTLLRDADAVVYEVRARLPGEVVESNGEVEGRVLTWRIEPGERIALAATGERPAGSWPLLAGAGALGGVLALGVLWALRRSRGAGRGGARG